MRGLCLAKEQWFQVPLKKIFRDIFGNDRLVFFERIEITFTFLRSDFETDVHQLAEARIIILFFWSWRNAATNCSELQPFTVTELGSLFY